MESFEHGWGIVSGLTDEVRVMSLFTRQRVGIHREYTESVSAIFATYLKTRHELYQRERRWPGAAFWTMEID